MSFTSHSHTVSACQPAASSSCRFLLSRICVFSNFGTQYSRFDFGVCAILQPGCWCQKHPCMNTTFFRPFNTRSGLPGNSFPCNRYPNPSARISRLTALSGEVSFPLIFRMFALLWDMVILSICYFLPLPDLICARMRLQKSSFGGALLYSACIISSLCVVPAMPLYRKVY